MTAPQFALPLFIFCCLLACLLFQIRSPRDAVHPFCPIIRFHCVPGSTSWNTKTERSGASVVQPSHCTRKQNSLSGYLTRAGQARSRSRGGDRRFPEGNMKLKRITKLDTSNPCRVLGTFGEAVSQFPNNHFLCRFGSFKIRWTSNLRSSSPRGRS